MPQRGGDVDRVERGRVHGDLAGARDAEDAADAERQGASPSMSRVPARYSRPALRSPLTRRRKRSTSGGRAPRRPARASPRCGRASDLAAAKLEPVPLEEPVRALEVEADDAVQEREPLGDGVLVEPGEDHRDRDRPDLVAPDQATRGRRRTTRRIAVDQVARPAMAERGRRAARSGSASRSGDRSAHGTSSHSG